jgi:Putative prokaryotic signal transducing protein
MVTRPKPNPSFDPDEKLVKVFDSEQETEALVVRGLLESAGIDAMTQSLDAQQEVFPIGGVVVLVREEDADEARRIIEENRQEAASGDENDLSDEEDISDESPSEP